MESAQPDFERFGASLWVIAAQRPSRGSDPLGVLHRERWFPILLDTERKVTKAYGVFHALSIDAYRIARLSTFILRRDGRIAFIHVSAHQWECIGLDGLWECLRDL